MVHSRKFRCVYVCSSNTRNALGSFECSYRVSRQGFLSAIAVHHPVNRAVLASFLLNEELGHLGRLGCTICLIGSLIIVLHAPEDKPVETVDEILEYALRPGASWNGNLPKFVLLLTSDHRVPTVLLHSNGVYPGHDIRYCPEIRTINSTCLYLHLLSRWLRVRYGYQGFRRCSQTHLWREQSIYSCKHIRFRCHRRTLYRGSDELL
jgi:hypothetical protein